MKLDARRVAFSHDLRSDPGGDSSLSEVLQTLGDRVAPVTMARERTLPITPVLAPLFPERALVRGRVLACSGTAATSLAMALLAPPLVAGSWAAIVDVDTLGLDAAREAGVPLERLVAITTDGDADPGRWADAVAAAADGFDLVVGRVPAGIAASTVRKVAIRLQQRGVVMIVLGHPGPLTCDGVLETSSRWSGLGSGWGYLERRSVDVIASGRRMPGRSTCTLELPDDRSVTGDSVLDAGGVPGPMSIAS